MSVNHKARKKKKMDMIIHMILLCVYYHHNINISFLNIMVIVNTIATRLEWAT